MIPDFRYMLPRGLDDSDPVYNAIVTKANSCIAEWLQDILLLNRSYQPDIVNSALVDEIAYMLNANIAGEDTERTKRGKIAGAIRMHKQRSLWQSIKVVIDSIMGGDSSLLTAEDCADWIFYGADGNDNNTYNWGVFATDGITTEWGIDVFGTFIELVFKGNIYINCDNPTATTELVEQLKLALIELVPCYVKIYLGYSEDGVFNQYSNGVMG